MPPAPIDRAPPPAAWHGRRGELLVGLQFVLFFAFALMPRWNPWLTPDLLAATMAPRLVVPAACALVALAFGGLGSRALRSYITPLPYPVDHSRLVTSGVYAIVRHPLYSALLFAALGWVCYTLSLSHLALLVVAFLFFDYKAGKEEGWLIERHPEYRGYAARVKKFVPFLY